MSGKQILVAGLAKRVRIVSLDELDRLGLHRDAADRARQHFKAGAQWVEFVPTTPQGLIRGTKMDLVVVDDMNIEAPPPSPQPRPFVPWTAEQMRDEILGMVKHQIVLSGELLWEASKYRTAQYTEKIEHDLSNWQRLLAYVKEKLK
jgi:hypothetical protein